MTLPKKILAIAAALLALSQQAVAAPLYKVLVFPGGAPIEVDLTSATPGLTSVGSATRTGSGGSLIAGNWSVQANQGSMQSNAAATMTGVYGTPVDFSSRSTLFYDDLKFSGAAGPGLDTFNVILNLRLTGAMSFQEDSKNPQLPQNNAFGQLSVDLLWNTPSVSGQQQRIGTTSVGGGSGFLSGLGTVVDEPAASVYDRLRVIDANLSLSFQVSNFNQSGFLNQLTIKLFADARGGDLSSGDGVAPSFSNFDLSFAIDRPVFEVPDGVTVNSEQAGIVDNQFSLSNDVPEPASFILLGSGALGLLGADWRRGRRAAS